MNQRKIDKLSARDKEKLEKYIKAFIYKVPQAIVLSRCGEKRKYIANSNSPEIDIFEIAIEDNAEIHSKVKEACSSINPLKAFSLSVEVLLKTAEGDMLVLETWTLCLMQSEMFWDPKYRVYAESEIVISNLMTLLKSVITVSRAIPSFKLSLGQSALTYVILYRIYSGEPQLQHLGTCAQMQKVGEVYTPAGTIDISVVYRSKMEMTIAPQSAQKENSFMVRSDYFNLDMSPKRSCGSKVCKNYNTQNLSSVGAFATFNLLSDPIFPELAFLQKNFLHPSRSNVHCANSKSDATADLNFNVSASPEVECIIKRELEEDAERLSDVSDGSDFVFVNNVKPPFADCDPDSDLGMFYQQCQCAPPLTCFSNQPSLQEQVLDVTNQLEKFEISMMDFDKFVDSVCQTDTVM